jgi:very-short-patch-repair endonuclease
MALHGIACALAEAQHGVVSIIQLHDDGATDAEIKHLTQSGHWVRLTPLVLCRVGSPKTIEQRVSAAVLDAGRRAGLSHWSAAAWFDLPGFRLRPLHVIRLRDATSTPSRLATIHEPRALPDHHLCVHRGVSVTVPSRIPFDIASRDPRGAERALDRGWVRHLLNRQSELRMLDDLAERGRRGITLMRQLLDAREPDYRPNDTGLEDRFQELCRQVGLVMERQRNLLGLGEWLGRVDFVNESLKLVIEVDSALYHDALIDQRADEARRALLTAADYRVRSFTDHEIFYDRAGSLERLRAIRSGA